jgi:translation initiation factor 3 subunit J
MSALISRHESNPLYSAFVEQFTKDLCENLTAVQTRKIASALSVLGNTKQQDERDKASGKKKVSITCLVDKILVGVGLTLSV